MSTDWAEVYRTSYLPLFRFVHRKVWDEDRAKDLVQETFARALSHDPDNPRAWLFRVAGNLARDEARQVVRRKRHLALLNVEAEGSSGESPAEALETEAKVARLREILETLPERDRDLLLLWDAGLSYDAIAEQLGLSRGAVGTTLARAKRKLVDAHEALEDPDVALG